MTINEAIKELKDDELPDELRFTAKFCETLQLGVEALKYIQYRDNCPGINTRLLLPGESED